MSTASSCMRFFSFFFGIEIKIAYEYISLVGNVK